MKLILGFFAALPELFKLFQILQKRIDEAQVERKVSQDIKQIHEAFGSMDASKLNSLFSE